MTPNTTDMAPEVLISGQPYNMKVDVYSFSIVFWEMLEAKIPFGFVKRKSQLVDYVGEYPSLERYSTNDNDADVLIVLLCTHFHSPRLSLGRSKGKREASHWSQPATVHPNNSQNRIPP